jgi:hypothetical protein
MRVDPNDEHHNLLSQQWNAAAGTPDEGVAVPVSSHATAPDTSETVSSLGSQPESGRAFSRPLARALDATNNPQRVRPILYQGNLARVDADCPEIP